VDIWGHLGGLVVGMLISSYLFTTSGKYVTVGFAGLLALYFVAGFLVFYILVSTHPLIIG
jgi:hypothetical protein